MPRSLRVITNRIAAPELRRATFKGREYLVFPAVMLRSQVLHCEGCEEAGEYIPAEEIAASLPGWQGRPVTLGHPKLGGEPVSANLRSVLEKEAVGLVFDPFIEGSALKGEVWIDLVDAKRAVGGPAFLERLEAGETIEVSTGYYRTADPTPGEADGKTYGLVQRDLLPDHFAMILDGQGACSIADGCGAPRTNAAGESLSARVRAVEDAVWRRNDALAEHAARNDMPSPGPEDYWYTIETYDDVIIVRQGNQLLQVAYSFDADGAVQFGAETEVQVEYRPVATAGDSAAGVVTRLAKRFISRLRGRPRPEDPSTPGAKANADGPTDGGTAPAITANSTQEIDMDRTKLIQRLAANQAAGFTAVQLEAMNDIQLAALDKAFPAAAPAPATNCGCQDKGGAAPAATATEGEPARPAATATAEAPAAPALTAEVLGNALKAALGFDPAELKSVIDGQKASAEARKGELVGRLAANAACPLDEAELKELSVNHLEKLDRSYAPASYLGLGGPRGFAPNAADDAPPAPPAVLLAPIGNATTTKPQEN